MENGNDKVTTECLNCNTYVAGYFCPQCGQSVRDNTDRSIGKLLGDFLDNIFFYDNRFLISLRYLFRYPSRITVEFLAGKRKKFVSPVTLFLFVNVIYFFVNPLSDYSISLEDQYTQPYAPLIKDWINGRLQNEGLDFSTYSSTYQNMSDTISKSVIIINIPMIALGVYLMAFKKRRFYYDSLIFTFHFFSLFLASWILLDWIDTLIAMLAGHEESVIAAISFLLFTFAIPLCYAILGMKKFLDIKWYWAIPGGIGVILAVAFANVCYRLIIFILSMWFT
ncbi:DUF3667 domain-containing protein [Maribacter chungangensis]|uniref:DUF3667 domain-containing protein n=1 Tax=Maribacter chungangensis TaxID=1069117 RepID=A0ABW3B2Y5_9FLAO